MSTNTTAKYKPSVCRKSQIPRPKSVILRMSCKSILILNEFLHFCLDAMALARYA